MPRTAPPVGLTLQACVQVFTTSPKTSKSNDVATGNPWEKNMKSIAKLGAVSALSLILGATSALAEDIKIAFIDPLSGPFASTGTNGLHQFEFAADHMINEKGGVLGGKNFEIVAFDNNQRITDPASGRD